MACLKRAGFDGDLVGSAHGLGRDSRSGPDASVFGVESDSYFESHERHRVLDGVDREQDDEALRCCRPFRSLASSFPRAVDAFLDDTRQKEPGVISLEPRIEPEHACVADRVSFASHDASQRCHESAPQTLKLQWLP